MSTQMRFDGKVTVVTGAGAGLGRAYALWFAERGSCVVVNDLGGSVAGEGASSRPADQVVEEITARGGKAVADYNSVEDGEKIVETAINVFGRIDILVNNAGILRDKSFINTSDQDWDIVQRVHLRGPFKTIRAAWPHFRRQNYGRIIVTSSAVGLFGNFGQANYSAAKSALIGLSNTLAKEGIKYNIHCNAIVPTAGSRLTQTVMPPELGAQLKPESVAPIVLWLCHESCRETGSVIETAAGWASKYRWVRSKGVILREGLEEMISPESVRDHWDSITHFDDTKSIEQLEKNVSARVIRKLADKDAEKKNVSLSPVDQAMRWRPPGVTVSVSPKDIILYALSMGVSIRDSDSLRFVYEGHKKFAALPTFGILLAQRVLTETNLFTGGLPGWKSLDSSRVLHGEQFIEIHQPIPTRGNLFAYLELMDILDKKTGAVMIINVTVMDEQRKETILTAQWSNFLVGYGGFGGKNQSEHVIPTLEPPRTRKPDVSIHYKTFKDQSAMYRLLGGRNPLHIDPAFAAMGGYKTPILHGLIAYGVSCRHVLQYFAGNDHALFKSMKGRFSSPTMPGDTLEISMWREGNRIHLETRNLDTGKTVLSGGYVDLKSVVPQADRLINNSAAAKL